MDSEILQRHLEGDPDARLAVERSLRIYAAALLEDPAFRMDDAASRGLLVRSTAAEALNSGGRSEDELLTRVVLTAARHGVEHLRARDPVGGSDHLPAPLLVSCAVAPHVVAGPALAAAEAHLAACHACAAQVRIVRDVVRRAVEAARAEEAGGVESYGATPPVPPRDPQEGGEPAARRVPMPRPVGARTRATVAPPRSASRLRPALLGLLLGAVVVAIAAPRCQKEPALEAARDPSLGSLAQVPEPRPPPIAERASAHVLAFQDLEAGRHALAGTRMRKVRRANPSDVTAWYWEGLAFLCAGQGPAAAEALAAVARSPRAVLFPDLDFYRGQAALMAGDRSAARTALEASCAARTALSSTACEQAARLK
ncbi:MAG: hypothetical protein JXB39_07220 [Deltaproteobacteria bacterium]|nr:hypothetical protein [Deltaproteobacteria bacterium]